GNFKGVVAPADATSKEKSCSSRSRLCSILRLTSIQSCRFTPLSPSITTEILESVEMEKSIRKRSGCCSSPCSSKSLTLLLKSIFFYKKRGRNVPSLFSLTLNNGANIQNLFK